MENWIVAPNSLLPCIAGYFIWTPFGLLVFSEVSLLDDNIFAYPIDTGFAMWLALVNGMHVKVTVC